MPYGDAMLIDNRVRAMVMSLPERYALGYPCCVFSKNNSGDDFLAYLQGIEREAVRNLGRGVYTGRARRNGQLRPSGPGGKLSLVACP